LKLSSANANSSSPPLDLPAVEEWLRRNSPQSSSMAVLFMQVERFVHSRLHGLARFSYDVGQKAEIVEIEMIAVGGQRRVKGAICLCCHSGRFFKNYGSSPEERAYFKGAMDAARYLVFALGGTHHHRSQTRGIAPPY